MRFKGDIKSSLLYDVGVCKKEMDEYKESLDKVSEEYEALKIGVSNFFIKSQSKHKISILNKD